MKVISLFCGIGGLDKGFLNCGYNIVWANDINKYAVETYNANYSHKAIIADINEYPIEDIPDAELIIGGFPCQPFSMMGKELGFKDSRGNLFFRIEEIIQDKISKGRKPKAIVLENVRRLSTHDNGNTIKTIRDILVNKLEYKFDYKILNSLDYGVPQIRNRTYIVCFDNKLIDFKWPEPRKNDSITLQDVLEDVEDLTARYYLSDRIIPTILSNGTGGYYSKSETDRKYARPLCATMAKMHRANQDNYITQHGRLRRLTPRECARLQGFDAPQESNFVFPKGMADSHLYEQFGNAVTVNVAEAVASAVKEALVNCGEWNDE